MITFEQAIKLADCYIDIVTDGTGAVLHDITRYRPYGWLFLYQSKKYIEHGEFSDQFVGNVPVFINRFTHEILRFVGTARQIDYYLAEYESTLPDYQLKATDNQPKATPEKIADTESSG